MRVVRDFGNRIGIMTRGASPRPKCYRVQQTFFAGGLFSCVLIGSSRSWACDKVDKNMYRGTASIVLLASIVNLVQSVPSDSLSGGTVLGATCKRSPAQLFQGIPYAQPPTGGTSGSWRLGLSMTPTATAFSMPRRLLLHASNGIRPPMSKSKPLKTGKFKCPTRPGYWED